MKYSVIVSDRANETFDAIKQQIENRWGEKIAEDFEKKTLKVLETLTHSPLLYQCLKYDGNYRKCVLHKNCSMLYRINNTEVRILYFWDNRQEPIF